MRKTSIARRFLQLMTIDPHDEMVVATNLSSPSRRSVNGPQEPSEPPRQRWIFRVLMLLVPAAVALALVSLLVGERARVDCDLQVIGTTELRPGSSAPVRALFYTGLQSIEGPRLSVIDAQARLLDASDQVVRTEPMRHGHADTLEATLPIPDALRGPFTIDVTARDQRSAVVASLRGTISDSAPRLATEPRSLRPLQQFAAGPLRRESEALPPSALEAQLIGGACAPELPCEVLVHVGTPPAQIGVDTYGGLDLVTPPPSQATEHVVRFTVRTHGPESELRLVASNEGQVVARRTFRLAVAQVMVPMVVPSVVDADVEPPRITRASTDSPCIVDLFHDDHWVRTLTAPRCDDFRLPVPLAPGLWRVQSRDDAYGGDTTAVRVLYARARGERDETVLAKIAERVVQHDRNDLMARRVLERTAQMATQDFAGYSAWLLATLEAEVIPLPKAVSSYPVQLAALEQKRAHLRMYSLIALALSAVAAIALIARRGLRASARARDILGDAGDAEAHSDARRWRMTLTVIASAAAMALAFVAIALYVIARG